MLLTPPPARRRRGFTLVELIIVIVVVGLLAAIAVPTFRTVQARTLDSRTTAELAAVHRAGVALATADLAAGGDPFSRAAYTAVLADTERMALAPVEQSEAAVGLVTLVALDPSHSA